MEGYYGRERHETFDARRLVPHRRPVSRRRRRLLLLPRPARRHDQDRAARTCRRARSRPPSLDADRARRPRRRRRRRRAAGQLVAAAVRVPDGRASTTSTSRSCGAAPGADGSRPTRCRSDHARPRRRRRPDDVERQARRPGRSRSDVHRSDVTSASTSPSRRCCVATAARAHGDLPAIVDRRRGRSPTPSSTTRVAALARPAGGGRASARAPGSGSLAPNGIEWAVTAVAVLRDRRACSCR